MKVLLFALVFGTLFSLFSGGDWRVAALGGLCGVLVAAFQQHMPLIDWLYPRDNKEN